MTEKLCKALKEMFTNEKAQGMVEYSLVIGLIALSVFISLQAAGQGIQGILDTLTGIFP